MCCKPHAYNTISKVLFNFKQQFSKKVFRSKSVIKVYHIHMKKCKYSEFRAVEEFLMGK